MSKTGYNYCADLVKRNDEDRYLSALFAPPVKRLTLFALYAFAHEIAHTASKVSEPMLGEIRFQWWREAVDGLFAGAPRRHEVIEALADSMERQPLPRAPFDALINAHARDLEGALMVTEEEVVTYAQAISFPVMLLGALALTGGETQPGLEKAAHSAGMALALTGFLRKLAMHLARGRCMIPQEILARHSVDVEALHSGSWDTRCGNALREMIGLVQAKLNDARADIRQVADVTLPVFLPLSFCEAYLKIMSRPDFTPFRHSADVSLLGRQFRMIAAMITRRF